MDQKAAEIAAIPGPVVCPVMTICRRAGKPFVFDAFAVDQRLKTGHLSPDELKQRLKPRASGSSRSNVEAIAAFLGRAHFGRSPESFHVSTTLPELPERIASKPFWKSV